MEIGCSSASTETTKQHLSQGEWQLWPSVVNLVLHNGQRIVMLGIPIKTY